MILLNIALIFLACAVLCQAICQARGTMLLYRRMVLLERQVAAMAASHGV